jgi:MFS family permease
MDTKSAKFEHARPIRSRAFILTNLTIAHGITHLYGSSLFVILPYIQSSLGLSNLQYGSLFTLRQLSMGGANIPAGFIIDMAKSQWGLILTGCMVTLAIVYMLLATSTNFVFLAVVMMMTPIGTSLWHLPAFAAISQRYPERRGFALSMHNVGAQFGASVGPLMAGGLLALLAWRGVALIYVIPAAVMSFVVWWSLRDLGSSDSTPNVRIPVGTRIREAGRLLRRPAIIGLVMIMMLRHMGTNSLTLWLPRYLKDPIADGGLEMGPFMIGLHVAMLTTLGVASSPVLGALSDRYGRKLVLVPCLAITALLAVAIGQSGDGPLLTLSILAMGMFSLSLGQIMQATLLDQIGRGTEGTTIGLIMGINTGFIATSPIIAALIVDAYGIGAVFFMNASLWAAASLLVLIVPLKRPPVAARQ